MSDLGDLEDSCYDEARKELRFVQKGMRAMFRSAISRSNIVTVNDMANKSADRRNVPITLPKIKFLED